MQNMENVKLQFRDQTDTSANISDSINTKMIKKEGSQQSVDSNSNRNSKLSEMRNRLKGKII